MQDTNRQEQFIELLSWHIRIAAYAASIWQYLREEIEKEGIELDPHEKRLTAILGYTIIGRALSASEFNNKRLFVIEIASYRHIYCGIAFKALFNESETKVIYDKYRDVFEKVKCSVHAKYEKINGHNDEWPIGSIDILKMDDDWFVKYGRREMKEELRELARMKAKEIKDYVDFVTAELEKNMVK